MKRRIYAYLCLMILATALSATLIVAVTMQARLEKAIYQSVKTEAVLISTALSRDAIEDIEALIQFPESSRLTLFKDDGTVLYDKSVSAQFSPVTAAEIFSYSEVVQAFETGNGERQYSPGSIRYQNIAVTIRIADGTVLRVEKVIASLFQRVLHNWYWVLFFIIAVLLTANFFTNRIIGGITSPINRLNPADLSSAKVDDLFSPLIKSLLDQQMRFDRQISKADKRQVEFSQVLHNMREGLIILNSSGNIITINQSALNYFGAENEDYTDKSIYVLIRRAGLQRAVETAQEGHAAEELIYVENRYLQLLVNPISDNMVVQGVLLLVLDVTEKHDAEIRRREFSANVSHELKTPLTTISGYAELLKNGLVKPADMTHFSERIYSEANRMSELISDIIALSKLDERQADLPFEPVDLLQLMIDVSARFTDSANERGVTISLVGQPVVISGIRTTLAEMFFNVCDNALKYNLDGGSINISVSETENAAIVTVADSGIGIPAEDLDRVFERFYRVDKSHSKETGGTGLGLSIVKHGALIHHARITLESTLNVGTTIRFHFPMN